MKGCDSTKIEAVGDSPTDQLNDAFCCLNNITKNGHGPLVKISFNSRNNSETDTSSIALTTYNIECSSKFSTPTIDDSTLPNNTLLGLDSLSFPFPFQRSSVEPLFRRYEGIFATQLPSQNGVCSYGT